MRGLPQFLSFYAKTTGLIEKRCLITRSLTSESFSKDLFEYSKIKYGGGVGETFLVPHTGQGLKMSPTLSFLVETWGNTRGEG
jgi:hypothetical protein